MDPNNLQPQQNPAQPPQAVDGMMSNPAAQTQMMPGQSVSPAQQPMASTAQPSTGITPSQQPDSVVVKPKKPKFLLIAVIGLAVIALLVVITLVLSRPKKKPDSNQLQSTQTQQIENTGPQPAEAIDVEQSNTSINQDVSGLNTDNDFPAAELEDKALGL